MAKTLAIIGAGGHAVSVCSVAISAGYDVRCFVDAKKAGQKLVGIDIVESIDPFIGGDVCFAIAVGANFARQHIFEETRGRIPLDRFPSLIHRSAVVSSFSEVGHGAVVMPNTTIGPNCKVGIFCLLNTNSSIDHDCVMNDFASLAPASNTGGNVAIGSRSAISIGAKIKHGVRIGDDTVIGANAYVHRDVGNNKVAYGTPAKVVRERSVDEDYLA